MATIDHNFTPLFMVTDSVTGEIYALSVESATYEQLEEVVRRCKKQMEHLDNLPVF